MKQEIAETLAIKALAWMAADDSLMPVFMGASGLTGDDIKTRAQEPEFLGAVLDFLMMDDAWVMAFCDAEGCAYDMPMRARQCLPGGEQVNWT